MTPTVVIVDDDEDDLEILRHAIKGINESIVCVSFVYPDEALRVVSKESKYIPDYFFIDINMPIISGDKLLQELRRNTMLNRSVITMLSTTMPQKVSHALLQAGANHVFQKPSRVSEYREILAKIIVLGNGN